MPCRGGFETRPYANIACLQVGKPQQAMDVIWHHDKFIQLNKGVVLGQICPCFLHQFPEWAQVDSRILNLTQHIQTVLNTKIKK
jgi:hypothetical protein